MSKILYGSSNVYRHISRARGNVLSDFELVKCTKKVVFDSHLANLGLLAPGSVIVTSVLANFIVDACQGLDESKVPLFAGQQITAHVEALANVLRQCTDVKVFIVPPLMRKNPGLSLVNEQKKVFIKHLFVFFKSVLYVICILRLEERLRK